MGLRNKQYVKNHKGVIKSQLGLAVDGIYFRSQTLPMQFPFIMLSKEPERVKNLNFSLNDSNNDMPFSTRKDRYKNKN